jgi:hypothetical protein
MNLLLGLGAFLGTSAVVVSVLELLRTSGRARALRPAIVPDDSRHGVRTNRSPRSIP